MKLLKGLVQTLMFVLAFYIIGGIMKVFKTVEGPKNIIVKKGQAQTAFDLFANIINKEVQNGWEYHSMETLAVTEKPGCFQKPETTYSYMLIFYKEQ